MLFGHAIRLGVLLGLVLALEGAGWSQCAMCRTALESSPEGQAIAEGFRHGILFLLAAPYAIVGAVAVGALRWWKKGEREPF
jgi:hypothetical protein